MYTKNSFRDFGIPRQSSTSTRHNNQRQSSSAPDLTLLLSLTLFTSVIIMIAFSSLPKHRLENHPKCGITTGGKDECYFDCSVVMNEDLEVLVEDLSCLADCFEKTEENCVTSLLNDVISNGVCFAGQGIYTVNDDCEFDESEYVYDPEGSGFEESEYDYENEEYGENKQDDGGITIITKGTCSDKTENVLLTNKCLQIIFEKPEFILNTINTIIVLSCRANISESYFIFAENNNLGRRSTSPMQYNSVNKTRLAPAQIIFEEPKIRTILEYENTRNRYPWVCSLRSKGPSPEHRCAVNLLSIPPGPTVLVGAAHCTYLCKDGSREVPVCCCSDGTDDCSATDPRCGDDPGVVKMTGEDSLIVCGEWDTSMAMSVASGERYNVKLPILEILRNPGFDPRVGPLMGSDVVVFKVDDSQIQNNTADTLQLWPACLPSRNNEIPLTGIHTGWSQPPPILFVQSQAPGFTKFYNDFYKQWHYKMDIFHTCEDPKESGINGEPLKYPSNSSYPPGTVCAKDFTRQSCFSTGESGSPLMVNYGDEQDRTYIEGILSFVKGCDQFQFGEVNDFPDSPVFILRQKSENPTTYTRLSCYMPWIAAQYGMEYEVAGSLDQACYTGSGDPEDTEKNICRNTHSTWDELREDTEAECIFPFYYKGKKYEECILFNEEEFLYPVFRCPIRNITTKIEGINSFNSSSFNDVFCLSDTDNDMSTLIPDKSDCYFLDIRPPFSQCKNNCPGVKAFGIIGGGAVLATVGALGGLGTLGALPSVLGLGGIGAVGVGGTLMMAQRSCAGPFFCTSLDGRCCLVVVSTLACPDTC